MLDHNLLKNYMKLFMMINILMKNISLKGNFNFENKKKEKEDYELFSLKITDSLYKKDIGKFLETISSHFI